MLVLSRKRGEKIMIGTGPNAIVVELVDVLSAGRVRIGISAPRSVPVMREELLSADQRQELGLPPLAPA